MSRVIKFRVWCGDTVYYATPQDMQHAYPLAECSCSGDDLVYEQFTGLLDKAGREIYEGDIVEQPYLSVLPGPKDTSVFSGVHVGIACWMGEMGYSSARWCISQSGNDRGPDLIGGKANVVGDIHQNPELLAAPQS